MNHSNCDIRVLIAEDPLGWCTHPYTQTSGKGSRIRSTCKCGAKIESCGQRHYKEGNFHMWYSIKHMGNRVASCSKCWLEIYDKQVKEDELRI